MVPEAPLERTEHGLVPAGDGWFVVNAREARWQDRGPRGVACRFEGEQPFPQVGVRVFVLEAGQPMSMYHAEPDQEDFLVVAGEALLVIEGQERPLRQWDFVHCPPCTAHAIVGAGSGRCLIVGVGSRTSEAIVYPVDEVALRHGVGVEQETPSIQEAYARFPTPVPSTYRDGWLPHGL